MQGHGSQTFCIWILALPVTNAVTSGMLSDCFVPQCPYLLNGSNNSTHLPRRLWGLNMLIHACKTLLTVSGTCKVCPTRGPLLFIFSLLWPWFNCHVGTLSFWAAWGTGVGCSVRQILEKFLPSLSLAPYLLYEISPTLRSGFAFDLLSEIIHIKTTQCLAHGQSGNISSQGEGVTKTHVPQLFRE